MLTKTDAAGTTRYDYDALGNLTSVTQPDGSVVEYLIDAQNRRVGRKVDGTITHQWLYSDQLRIIAELDADGAITKRFVYSTRSNVPDSMVMNGARYRIYADHLGSPRAVVNIDTGAVVQAMRFDEFGRVLLDTNPGFVPFGYAGGTYDPATNLIRFGERDYDPQTGRWTAKDPIGFGGGETALYSYIGNDPMNFIDPSGLDAITSDPHALAEMAALFRRSLLDSRGSEWSAIMYTATNGQIYCRGLGSSYSANSNRSIVPKGLTQQVFVHTHPRKRTIFANDPDDVIAANKLGTASYVLSVAGIHKFMPDGKGGGAESTEIDNLDYLRQNGKDWYDFTDQDACSCSGLRR